MNVNKHPGQIKKPANFNMEPVYYCSMPLNRNSDLRQDNDWLDQQFSSDAGLVVVTWQQQNLVRFTAKGPAPVYVGISDAALLLANAVEVTYLGHDDTAPVWAIDLGDLEQSKVVELLAHSAPDCQMINLRKVGTLLDAEQASILAYARSMAFWHQNNGFCATCGNANHGARGGHMRVCDHCNRQTFPRIDPAVIMLVEQNNPQDGIPKCLLGRHAGLPGKMYSTLAGFVDPIENLEQAVIREIFEEAGLRVQKPVYLGSQPWPFPASMMFGFRAGTDDRTINIDPDELEHADWFSVADFEQFGEMNDEDVDWCLPPQDSIARQLINHWLEQHR